VSNSFWQTDFVHAAGLRLRVAQRAGAGRPLLLITGIGAHIDMWEPLQRHLAGRAVLAFDAPGTGRSPAPRRPMRMAGYADVVGELLDVLRLRSVDVLGYSWGGALAQELAHRSPERVARLVLCATGPGWLGGTPPRPLAAALLATPARYYHPWLLERSLPHIAGGRTRRERATQLDRQAAARLAHRPSPLGYAHQLFAISGWTSLPWLHELGQPTLVVAGDDDPAVPLRNSRALAKRIPGARLHIVRGGGHLFLLDQPEAVAPEIVDFLVGPDPSVRVHVAARRPRERRML
jgi:poly(3-hydroxyalkanoate) depolymerase